MRTGLDRLPDLPRVLHGLRTRRVALLAHPASLNRDLVHISRVLASLDVRPVRIFGPEHGYGGEAQDMIGVADAHDLAFGSPIVSLYGESFEDLTPGADQLDDLDVVVVDLSDVGSRYYTFVWTALLVVRAAHARGLQVVLLDRPNPIDGTRMEGKPQQQGYLSFVGLEPLPVRHGLTVGEVVAEMASRDGVATGPGEMLDVVAVEGWDRRRDARDWDRPFVMPSPNMPTADTAMVYPGGCLWEGTNVSEGRGTTRPFEVFGAPWLDGARWATELSSLGLPGFIGRPLTFCPTFHKHAGQRCGGLQVHVTDPAAFRPLATYVSLVALAAYQAPESFRFRTERYEFVDDIPAIDLLIGSPVLREGVARHEAPLRLVEAICPVGDSGRELHRSARERIAQAEARRG